MRTLLRPALSLLAIFTLITGLAYPLAITGVAQLVFPRQANGSLLRDEGQVIGSALIGQRFTQPRYFWGRPSATSPQPYNAAASTGSNLGPLNPALRAAVEQRVGVLRAHAPSSPAAIPVDLVTASGSGLDPDLSPAAALYQVARVARVRGLAVSQVRALVEGQIEWRTFGLLGEPRVNVLRLNLALDALARPGA
ncbi:MAG: potassium-transporting ATPase subunit KdpC [Proteobacteria bacterium]|nr:potassium-transporting ATPase subunit KdpC [Pseudomonadota bacterium]